MDGGKEEMTLHPIFYKTAFVVGIKFQKTQ